MPEQQEQNLSLEQQIRALLDTQAPDGTTKTPTPGTSSSGDDGQPITIRLKTGETITGKNYEEIARTLAARDVAPEPEEPAPAPGTAAREKYDQEKFAQQFIKDGGEGLDYLTKTKYGFSISELYAVLPVMATTIQNLTKKQQEQEAREFVKSVPDYVPSPENLAALEEVATEVGLNLQTQEGLAAAWKLAKVDGRVQVKGQQRQQDEPASPRRPRGMPRTSGGNSEDVDSIPQFGNLSDENLEALIEKNRDKVAAALLG